MTKKAGKNVEKARNAGECARKAREAANSEETHHKIQ